MLKEHNVDVYFEEQGIHSIQPGAEFYITIYGSIAQSESENISANVRWGKAQSVKEGNVPFQYKRFLGYRRGSDGKPEIDPEQAIVVKRMQKPNFNSAAILLAYSIRKLMRRLNTRNLCLTLSKMMLQFFLTPFIIGMIGFRTVLNRM